MPPLSGLLSKWRDDLAGWAIPESITSAVTESPWVLPRDVFARRADRLRQAPGGPSYDRERAALDPPGSVLDVGAGAGAACLPLADRTTTLTAVDSDDGMLARLASRARAAGLEARLLPGHWPGVAGEAGPADLVTCHHVLYNVPDLVPFIEALTGNSRRQVVVELTAAHPLVALNPLWLRFHGLRRPEGPAPPTSWPSWPRWACGQGTLNGIVRLRPIMRQGVSWWTPPGAGYACHPSAPVMWKRRSARRVTSASLPTSARPDGPW